jgi:hypothetical protein
VVFLVESYRSRSSALAAERLRRLRAGFEAQAIRLRGRLVVPADEMEYWLLEAASMVEVAAALTTAGIGRSRISEVEELALFA